jgi:predicted kinase
MPHHEDAEILNMHHTLFFDGIQNRKVIRKNLHLTVGLPRSGKTTWAKEQAMPIVSPDAIRLSLHGQAFIATAEPIVWAIAKLMVASLFEAGHNDVIVDACSISKKRREEWIDTRWELVFKKFDTSKEECLRRATATNRPELIPVIERMASEQD